MAEKDHAGGFLPEGFHHVPIEWLEEKPEPVAISSFDFSCFDSVLEEAREALGDAEEFRRFLAALIRARENEVRRDLLMQVVGLAAKFDNELMAWDLMKDACGIGALDGMTGPAYAKRWGISKQAWQQNLERMRAILGLRKTRTMRDPEARQNMRLRNFRRTQRIP